MSQYRTQNRTILMGVETAPGIDPGLAPATHALTGINPSWSGGPETLANDDEVTGALDTGMAVTGGGGAGFSLTVNLKGSGTAGQAPEFGAALRAAGLAETLTATDITGTAQGGGASSMTLHAGASSMDDAYKGMVIETTAGTGAGQTRVVLDYAGAGRLATVYPDWTTVPDATTEFAIRANAHYVSTSTALKTAAIHDYMHRADGGFSRLRKLLGAAANMQVTLPVRGKPQASFTFQGKFVKPTDVAKPAAPVLDTTLFMPVMAVDCAFGGVVTKFNQITFDLGNQLAQADDPADPFGIDVAGITKRAITGRINPPLELLSVRDAWQMMLDGSEERLWLRWGTTPGNRISILFPRIRFQGPETEDVNGFGHEGIPFAALGEDDGVHICFY